MNINYLTDSKGNKVAVQIPFKEWDELIRDYNKLSQYHRLKVNLRKSLREIEMIENGKKTASSLSEFLDEGGLGARPEEIPLYDDLPTGYISAII